MVVLTGKTQDGHEITDLTSWFEHAPPAKGAEHWKDYRSAKELARAWCRYGVIRVPDELTMLFCKRVETRGFRAEQAVAEMEIHFDEFGGPRNADLALWDRPKSKSSKGIAVTVEAKADESFGPTVGQHLAHAPQGGNIPERVARLSQGIFGQDVDATIERLRYQLLYGLAATVALAQEKKAKLALFVIHEFVSLAIDFDKFVQNTNDLEAFVRAVPNWEEATLKPGTLLPFTPLHGSATVPKGIRVSVGKVRSLIPFGSGGRVAVATVGKNSHQPLVTG